jgi:predicted peptidase
MGAHGALRLAMRHRSRFAALVAICGWGDENDVAGAINSLPIWFFHGAADPIVPARCSAELVSALASTGARDVRHTEYPGIRHECWDLAYAEPQLPEWLFAQKRSRSTV